MKRDEEQRPFCVRRVCSKMTTEGARNTSTASWILPFSALTHPPHIRTQRGWKSGKVEKRAKEKTSHCHDEERVESPGGKRYSPALEITKTRFVPLCLVNSMLLLT